MRNREILKFEPKNFEVAKFEAGSKFEARPKFEAKSEARPVLRPDQANEDRPGFRVCQRGMLNV